MKTFEEKLQILKQMHARSYPDALAYIKQDESRFAQLQVQKDWIDHPCTKALVELATEQIDHIVSVLANKEDISELDRKALFNEKRVHLLYLASLADDPESEMSSIEEKIDRDLKEND